MDKYKSDFIKEEDMRIDLRQRYIGDDVIRIVEIKHLPSGFVASSEDKSQLKAYNEALIALEDMINSFINSHA